MQDLRGILRAVVATLVVAGCGDSPTGGDLSLEPITVDSVDVLVMESAPPQASAHVKGVLGDGCSELHSVTQSRAGNTVTVTILRQRPRNAFCTQIARMYDEVIRLEGTYPAGRYVVRVNGFEKAFTTQ